VAATSLVFPSLDCWQDIAVDLTDWSLPRFSIYGTTRFVIVTTLGTYGLIIPRLEPPNGSCRPHACWFVETLSTGYMAAARGRDALGYSCYASLVQTHLYLQKCGWSDELRGQNGRQSQSIVKLDLRAQGMEFVVGLDSCSNRLLLSNRRARNLVLIA
jgi:hypothetical protein